MRFGYSAECLEHDPGSRHPESPDRLRAIRRALAKRHGVEYVEADPIDEAAAGAAHDPEYVREFREFCASGGGQWDPDTVAVEATWDAALRSAGQAVWVAEAALDGASGRETPFALGRPPGHHAVADDAMGFCFLNNAAIAAQSTIDDGRAERVAIVDWDVHHGNGTQDVFDGRGDVFYASIHERGFDAHEHDPISRMSVSTEGYGVLAARLRDLAARSDAGFGFVLEGGYGLETLSESITTVNEVFGGYEPVEPEGSVDDRAQSVIEEVRTAHGLGAK
ncbi:histone deacetylase [Halobacteriales archaeon QH_9_66_26]|nr:MAG: histone deacetylase [Halobacteriales archaeon QH_9_66_26]